MAEQNKKNRFLSRSAVMLFLFRDTNNGKEILLQKRYNTGYSDGMWDCAASGHIDEGESMKTAVIREAKEELGINANIGNITFCTMTHRYSSDYVYYDGFFSIAEYTGIPTIQEANKCSDLRWFNINNLPDNFMPDRMRALKNYFSGICYDETGWNTSNIGTSNIK